VGALGRRDARLAEARDHTLHNSFVRKRRRNLTDGLLNVRILNFAKGAIEAGDDLGDRANIAERNHAGCELAQLPDAHALVLGARCGQQRRDRAPRFYIRRQDIIRPEHAALPRGADGVSMRRRRSRDKNRG